MKIVIIGGGVQGLACAFSLSKRGIGPITLLESKRIGYGASSRNGGGIRAQFSNEPNILFAKWSVELFEKLTHKLGYQILFHHGGYMYLHYDEETSAQAEKDVELQNKHGVPTRLISANEAAEVVPGLNVNGLRVAQYNPSDASCHHDALLWAYLKALKIKRVEVKQGMVVSRLEKQAGHITGVVVGEETIPADQVIVAAGTWTRNLLKTVEIDVPTNPWRREHLVTEPCLHFVNPFVIDKKRGVSFHQTTRGEVIGNANVPVDASSMNWNSTRPLIEKFSHGLYELFPALGNIGIMRQWAGTRDFTPDGTPIMGPMLEVEGLWAVCGQSGVGFMWAPAIAEAIANSIAGEPPKVNWEIYSPKRFETGKELWERAPNRI